MPLKTITAVLAISLGLAHSGLLLAAGETPAKPSTKRLAAAEAGSSSSENLLARTVFQALVGEFALQRNDIKLGLDAWVDLARRTRDPKVIGRAAEVAGLTRQYDLALELTKMWLEVEPESQAAKQLQSSLLVTANRLDDLAPQITALLEQDKASLPANLMHLNRLLARHNDKKAVQKLVDRVTAPYHGLAEAHFAMGQAAFNAGDNLRALGETEKALQLRPDWEAAALIRTQLQARQSPATAIDSLQDFIKRYPEARDARLALARLLISEKQYDAARSQFDRLIKDNPDNPEVIYPVAMLALQQGDIATGRAQLERLLHTDISDKSTPHFFLGQIEQDEKKLDAALDHYLQVTSGEQYIAARSRAAQILLQQGKNEEARTLLHETRGSSNAERTQLTMAEAQLLREAGRHTEAFTLLETALKNQPDSPELLYESALTAERLGKPDVLEAHLTRLLKIAPDHAHALNALGYSWADRNIRLPEAYELISRALSLMPEDPFIMDSLGWVLYRQGKLGEALTTLQRAYSLKADPEIAAHIGELLWAMNRKDEARRLLSEAARQNPDSEVLNATIKKLLP
ncbi:tetratricopeptide repeat protein [Dechloromonas denitrificans]|jgi:tetratricopeptide (TPR) repeat protein|uniref:tetratricopeptide repeat protein n=1 Tax=Dechloromonas denitrificans TaxID=281362 RepID=UPI001CF8E689|nr:tetratricopeptide repeat protein [Dechloromonas denitrificans]UCV11260.1 tetratricopeptide repeat protein [Dechloromonas denitrificans]